MSGRFILTIDQGTTGTTALVVTKQGRIAAKAYSEFTQIYPKPGWVEHNPEEIWNVTQSVARQALQQVNARAKDIAAIGITNQRETTVVWDRRTGKPIHNAIVWQCRRTAQICEALKKKKLGPKFRKKTGLVIDAYFSGTKLKWILDQVKGARKDASKGRLAFGTIDSWLIYKLTNGEKHVTDYTNASRTMLYNIHKKEWDDEILKILNIPHELLPEVLPMSGIMGHAAAGVLLSGEIPISGSAGDQQAALFGQGCFKPGPVKNTYGTGNFALTLTGKKALTSKSGLLTTLASGPKGEPLYALEGSVFISGAAVQWLRDEVKLIHEARDSEYMAAKVEDTGGVYMVPAFVGLGAPHWDMDARGAIVGLTRGSNLNHIIRATLESIAYQSLDLIEAMKRDTGIKFSEIRVDGGATRNNLLMQFQADILGIPVVRPSIVETTALGAAFLAGLAVGFWKGIKDIEKIRRIDRVFEPKMDPGKRRELIKGWKKALDQVKTKK